MAAVPLSATFILDDKYSKALMEIVKNTQKADQATEQMKDAIKGVGDNAQQMEPRVINPLDKISKKLLGFVSIGYAVKKAFDLMWSGIQGAATQQAQSNTIQALVGNDQLGAGLYQYIGDYAKSSALGRTDLAKGFTAFNTVSRDLDDMTRLFKMTERLYAKDPTQGSEGAVFALKEALEGDTMSMRNRFGIRLSGETLRNYFDTGDISGGLDYIDQQMAKFGATQSVVDKNTGNLMVQLNMFSSNLKDAFGENMTTSMQPVLNIIGRLQEMLDAGKFQPFFDLFAAGATFVGNALAFVVDNAEVLVPVLIFATSAFVALKIATGLAAIQEAYFAAMAGVAQKAVMGLNATLLFSPLGLFIGLLAGGAALLGYFTSQANGAKNALAEDLNYDQLNKDLAASKALDVNVTNDEPISVSGDVQIEEDNLKYLMDLANRDYVAKFSTATLAPQMQVTIGQVNQTADINGITDQLANELTAMISNEAEGAY